MNIGLRLSTHSNPAIRQIGIRRLSGALMTSYAIGKGVSIADVIYPTGENPIKYDLNLRVGTQKNHPICGWGKCSVKIGEGPNDPRAFLFKTDKIETLEIYDTGEELRAEISGTGIIDNDDPGYSFEIYIKDRGTYQDGEDGFELKIYSNGGLFYHMHDSPQDDQFIFIYEKTFF